MSAAVTLAEALAAGDRDRIDAAIVSASSDGTLRPIDGAWVSAVDDDAAWRRLAISSTWRDAGFRLFHVKPHAATSAQKDTLAVVTRAVTIASHLNAPPLWVGGEWLVTLHLPQSTNLAQSLAGGAAPLPILEHCLDSLSDFWDQEGSWRSAVADAGLPIPPPFPLTSRYRAACVHLRSESGEAAARDLADINPPIEMDGPCSLFCDPKPANFIRPRSGESSGIFRIDLDLMTWSAPLSLQAAIAVFSAPSEAVGSQRQQTFPLRLALWDRWCRTRCTGSEPERMWILWYHLIRNLASALHQQNAMKIRAMADMLHQLIDLEPRFRSATAFRDSLAQTLSATGVGSG